MKISGTGALVGAGICAAARSAVIMLSFGQIIPVVFILPSAAIGVLVGVIAGSTGKPLTGAIIGGVLSAGVFEVFMLPCISIFGFFGSMSGDEAAADKFFQQTLIYALEMGIAGAIAGGVGGWAGRRDVGDGADDGKNSIPAAFPSHTDDTPEGP